MGVHRLSGLGLQGAPAILHWMEVIDGIKKHARHGFLVCLSPLDRNCSSHRMQCTWRTRELMGASAVSPSLNAVPSRCLVRRPQRVKAGFVLGVAI